MDVRLEFEDVGSKRHGAVGCAVVVDAAVEAIVGRCGSTVGCWWLGVQ